MTRPAILHRSLVGVVKAFNRNPWTSVGLQFVDRTDRAMYTEDGLWTRHAHAFVEEPAFCRAYNRAIKAGGFDYEIRWRAHVVLWAAKVCSPLQGAFVECGTGRGFMASAICNLLEWRERPFYLIDTFMATKPDDAGVQAESGCPNVYYATNAGAVRENFAEWPGVELVQGRIPECLAGLETGNVAFLHIDMNNAPAEEAAVRHFWPLLVSGGVLVYDDYGFQGYEAQRESADKLGDELGFSILSSPTGQGVVLKR